MNAKLRGADSNLYKSGGYLLILKLVEWWMVDGFWIRRAGKVVIAENTRMIPLSLDQIMQVGDVGNT
ncbi:hypothetical protein ZOSMA_70G00120 [Zostera marina]|uniref:Uncharacterized protein n=1 Tax=Zostera marina TaxID=29655 RepID=A0A0K9NQV2_ZOSMR|nr:hypothetical protein ZOSMA_70G00120 [Zostera marina]